MRPAEVERIKLTANLLNSIAAGTFIAAVIAPSVGYILGTPQGVASSLNVAALTLCGIMFATVLHLAGRRLLLNIRDDE